MTKRIDWSISALRFVAMCCIIACHLCQLYGLAAAWWLNVAVQVFLFVSGWIFGARPDIAGAGKWYKKRFLRICVPFWLVAVLLLACDCLFTAQGVGLKAVVLSLACLRTGSIPNGAHLWYISAMLLCYLVTPLLSLLWRRWGFLPLVIAALLFVAVGGRVVPSGIWCADYVAAFLLARMVRDGVAERRLLAVTAIACGGGVLSSARCARCWNCPHTSPFICLQARCYFAFSG